MVYHIQSKEDLNRVIENAGNKLVVIDFYATWCGPCKIISPKLEELAEKHKERSIVVKVDVDNCEDIAMEYNVSSMPTFVFIKDKKTLDMFVGGNAEKLEKNIENFVSEINILNKPGEVPGEDIGDNINEPQDEAFLAIDG